MMSTGKVTRIGKSVKFLDQMEVEELEILLAQEMLRSLWKRRRYNRSRRQAANLWLWGGINYYPLEIDPIAQKLALERSTRSKSKRISKEWKELAKACSGGRMKGDATETFRKQKAKRKEDILAFLQSYSPHKISEQ